MSYTYLQEQGEESSAECFSDIPVSVLLRLNLTQGESSSSDRGTESFLSSPFGTMLPPLMEGHGEETSILSAEDSLVRTSSVPAKEPEYQEKGAAYGERWRESFAKYSQDTSSWRIPLFLPLGDLDGFLETWPRWGSMRNGECWERPIWGGIAKGNECGLLPRPQRVDGKSWYVVSIDSARKRQEEGRQLMLIHVVGLTAYENLKRWWANPPFWEAMMGWPIDWTDCTPLGMDSIQSWLQQHSKF